MTSIRPTASTRIMDGSGVTVTLGLVAMTWAITAPTWLFMSVNPHLLDAVLSDLNGLSAVLNVVTVPAPPAVPGVCRSGFPRSGSCTHPGHPRIVAASGRAATRSAAGYGRRRGTVAPRPTATPA